jgi:hypothetical protein
MTNTTDFEDQIEIGDRDVYYLVIALHRYAGMPAVEILLMTSTVDYEVTWEVEDKDIPLWLLPIALLFLIAGTLMVVYYIWTRTFRTKGPPQERHHGPGSGAIGSRGPGRRPTGRPPTLR